MTDAAWEEALAREGPGGAGWRAYADWLEERGEEDKAEAVRWLVDNGKWPFKLDSYNIRRDWAVDEPWGWAMKGQSRRITGDADPEAELARRVFLALPCPQQQKERYFGRYYEGSRGAIMAAVGALVKSEYLRKKRSGK